MHKTLIFAFTLLLALSPAAFAQCGPEGNPCDDGNPCTVGDVCIGGVCIGTPLPDGTPCDDGNPCTFGDICIGGICVGIPVDCDDGNPMTLDFCDPITGCTNTPLSLTCNGDGGDLMGCTNCPCSNNALAGTLGGCLNSANLSASLAATGNPSVSLPLDDTADLRFSLSGAPANAFAILNSGDSVAPSNPMNPCFGLESGAQAAHFDGLRCAVQNTRRHGGRSADASGNIGISNSPWGGEGGPPVGLAQAGSGFVAGQTRHFQAIYRDDPSLSCMRALNTTQAIGITFAP